MADKTVRYTPEFKRQMVALARGGRTAASLAKEFGPSAWTIGLWVKQAARDEGKGDGGLTRPSARSSPDCGARTASSRRSGRSCQKPRPGSQRRAVPRSALRVREGEPGHPSGGDDVPAA